jgi:hypothetical protein
MWISRREWIRHQRELHLALNRALDAEKRLNAERERKDAAVLELASRVVVKHGGYGLRAAEPEVEPSPAPHPRNFTHEPTETDYAKLEHYKECYRQAGRSEDDAEAIWEMEMRGETPTYPYESEVEQ